MKTSQAIYLCPDCQVEPTPTVTMHLQFNNLENGHELYFLQFENYYYPSNLIMSQKPAIPPQYHIT